MLNPRKRNTSLSLIEWGSHTHHFKVVRQNRFCSTEVGVQTQEAKTQLLSGKMSMEAWIYSAFNIQI